MYPQKKSRGTEGPSYRRGRITVSKSPFDRGLSLEQVVFSLIETRLLYRLNPKSASRFRNAAGLGVVVSSKGHEMLRTRRNKAAHHLHT